MLFPDFAEIGNISSLPDTFSDCQQNVLLRNTIVEADVHSGIGKNLDCLTLLVIFEMKMFLSLS